MASTAILMLTLSLTMVKIYIFLFINFIPLQKRRPPLSSCEEKRFLNATLAEREY
jgi:hypothetical protein